MSLSSALTADAYLKNKKYFDNSLISLLEKQQKQILNLQKKQVLEMLLSIKRMLLLLLLNSSIRIWVLLITI